MSGEKKTELRLEIAHVLFIDIVGFSKLLIEDQTEALEELNEAVRKTDAFRATEAAGQLIRLPTGDGMVLVFTTSPEAPVECALQISQALKAPASPKVRMGIHSGPVHQVTDVNERTNMAGAGINIAQRVMDCGDARHILVSKHLADDLAQYRRWQPYLHPLGDCEVKHGQMVSVVNLYADGVGNPEPPAKFVNAAAAKSASSPTRTPKSSRLPALVSLIVFLALLGAGATWFLNHRSASLSPIHLGKSIAVLPFANLSANQENAFFTEGIQDEILTDLARIADLKVISRTSVSQYKSGVERNLREIAKQLGVSHLVEGSVQRSANRVRVNAQLIDARTDTHLWAQTYDRDLADVFAIQSEIAKTIADQLRVKLSPSEKAEIETPPTSNVAAFDLYSRAAALLARGTYSSTVVAQLREAVQLLDQAVALDPNFFLAYLRLATAHESLYFLGEDHTPARRALADASRQAAIRLRPDDGETHRAIALRLYHDLDYNGARAELEKARETLPNSSDIFEVAGYIDRRQGRWEESIQNHRKALELDPRNYFIYQQLSLTYSHLRRFPEMAAALDHALELIPGDIDSRVARSLADLLGRGDTEPLNNTIHNILSQNPAAVSTFAEDWFLVAMCRRDSAEAERAAAAISPSGMSLNGVTFPRPFCQAMAARLRGDEAAAREALSRARTEMEAKLRASPDYGNALVALGLMDAGLGRKEDAIREGRRAAELVPVSKEALAGSEIIHMLSVIYAWTGETDRAFEQLNLSAQIPAGVTYGELKLHPYFDPLRGDPRFDKITASLAPK